MGANWKKIGNFGVPEICFLELHLRIDIQNLFTTSIDGSNIICGENSNEWYLTNYQNTQVYINQQAYKVTMQ